MFAPYNAEIDFLQDQISVLSDELAERDKHIESLKSERIPAAYDVGATTVRGSRASSLAPSDEADRDAEMQVCDAQLWHVHNWVISEPTTCEHNSWAHVYVCVCVHACAPVTVSKSWLQSHSVCHGIFTNPAAHGICPRAFYHMYQCYTQQCHMIMQFPHGKICVMHHYLVFAAYTCMNVQLVYLVWLCQPSPVTALHHLLICLTLHELGCCRSCTLRGSSWQPRSNMPMQTQLC